MHELSIASYLLESVLAEAEVRAARRIRAISLVVGERTGVVEDALRFCFDLLAPDTVADGATITIRRMPMRFSCSGCACEYVPASGHFRCPGCGVVGAVASDGSELLIESLEIET